MDNRILGLHHITAIAEDAQRNYDFYTRVLGLRMVKRTVNFDDPETYHFYYGNEAGEPGTLLTFFPWQGARKGVTGVGMASEIGYSVPDGSLEFWRERLMRQQLNVGEVLHRFGEAVLPVSDPDGLNLALIVSSRPDDRVPWKTAEVGVAAATKGFHSVTLTLRKVEATTDILTGIFGYSLVGQEGNRYRLVTDAVPNAAIVDIVEEPDGRQGVASAGTNHHIAFRVANEDIQMEWREKIAAAGLQVTPKIDRDYFYSIYFREPGGVLFEIATDNPGFTVDEPLEELGKTLKLPPQYEPIRERLVQVLPPLIV